MKNKISKNEYQNNSYQNTNRNDNVFVPKFLSFLQISSKQKSLEKTTIRDKIKYTKKGNEKQIKTQKS